jgi:hypothetical protein
MLSRRRVVHPQETYRFSMTHTLSDYPLLIGEILRRDRRRAIQQAKRRSLLIDIGRVLGIGKLDSWGARMLMGVRGWRWMVSTDLDSRK